MTKHFADYVNLAIAIHGVAVVIVNLTPTPKDNQNLTAWSRILVRLYRAVEIIAGIVGPMAKR